LSDSALREKYSRRAADLAFDRFSWDIVAQQLEGIYEVMTESANHEI
jgi:glycosyltransferase involved in cell wall biosynthesis